MPSKTAAVEQLQCATVHVRQTTTKPNLPYAPPSLPLPNATAARNELLKKQGSPLLVVGVDRSNQPCFARMQHMKMFAYPHTAATTLDAFCGPSLSRSQEVSRSKSPIRKIVGSPC